MIRAFVAIELPESLIHFMLELIDTMKAEPDSDSVRWVKAQAMHLTLVFLGDTPESNLRQVQSALSIPAEAQAAFECNLGQLGTFPSWEKASVLFLGVEDRSSGLSSLQAAVQSAVLPLGFQPERRPYTPHLTLGRIRRDAARGKVNGFLERARGLPVGRTSPWRVAEYHLVQSELKPAGPVYTTLQSFRLRAPA